MQDGNISRKYRISVQNVENRDWKYKTHLTQALEENKLKDITVNFLTLWIFNCVNYKLQWFIEEIPKRARVKSLRLPVKVWKLDCYWTF